MASQDLPIAGEMVDLFLEEMEESPPNFVLGDQIVVVTLMLVYLKTLHYLEEMLRALRFDVAKWRLKN
ncbi:unnamed protein product [Meloidogyne enterolobii]|uniref:Uncharacterized protein n=1 Tax=Meloidogyne enterolobii TaxID=390850 RepID=A0ACB0YKE7_MELEN